MNNAIFLTAISYHLPDQNQPEQSKTRLLPAGSRFRLTHLNRYSVVVPTGFVLHPRLFLAIAGLRFLLTPRRVASVLIQAFIVSSRLSIVIDKLIAAYLPRSIILDPMLSRKGIGYYLRDWRLEVGWVGT